MIKFTLFKTPKPRQFNYQPLYYDPDKEAREERRRELLGDKPEPAPQGDYKPGEYIRKNMAYRRGMTSRKRTEKTRMRPIRTVLVLILLGIALWWVLS